MFSDVFENWQQAYHEFRDAVSQVPAEFQKTPGICAERSVREVIGLLAGWQREALRRYQDFQNGDTSNKIYDADRFNADSISALSLLNWREVVETFQFTCEDLENTIQQLPLEQVESDPRYTEWLVGITADLETHTTQIKSWLLARKDNYA